MALDRLDDLDVVLSHLDEVIFDTGAARVEATINEGWINAAAPTPPSADYQLGRTGPSRDIAKTTFGFTLQNQRGSATMRTIDAVRLANPQRRLAALIKRVHREGDVFWRAGRFRAAALPQTIDQYIQIGATFNQAERCVVSKRLAATGDHWYPDAAPTTDIASIDLSEGLPIIVVDARELGVAVPADHALQLTLSVASVARTLTLASGGASAVAGTDALREGLYFGDFTDPDNYTGAALPDTGTATLQWIGTGIATISDANRAIDIGVGKPEVTYE